MSLQVFRESKAELLGLHEKTQEDLDRNIGILKEWIKQVAHLPSENLLRDDNFLEINLIRNKYSIEKTKQKIENYCTLKGRYRYLFENIIGTVNPQKEAVFYFPTEILTDKLYRVMIIKVFDEETYDVSRECGVGLMQRELTSRYDYNDGEIIICDYTECSAHFVTKWRMNVYAHATAIALNGHSAKMKEIHVVNKWANILITFGKPLIPEKIRHRIYSHATIDTLKDDIPKKYLPKDYGGEQKSLRELQDDWLKIFEENRELLETAYDTVSREDLRVERTTEELQGTFKQLAVD